MDRFKKGLRNLILTSKSWQSICSNTDLQLMETKSFKRSVPHTAHGKRTILVAAVLPMESLATFAEVVIPRVARIDSRCRPIESVRFQSRILTITRAAPTKQGTESRVSSSQERLECRATLVIRIDADAAILLRQQAPFFVCGQTPAIA